MQTISRLPTGEAREVELEPIEVQASEFFERLLDDGHNIKMAVHWTRVRYAPAVTEEFLAWKAQ